MKEYINQLKESDNYRSLGEYELKDNYIFSGGKSYLNLSSNDYLGISSTTLQQQFFDSLDSSIGFVMSNPSSRLMSGNSPHYSELERKLAYIYAKDKALLFSSGYMLNSGVLPAITNKDSYIIADKLVHASLIDGIKMCDCKFTRFKHNDIEHLRTILEKLTNNLSDTLVVVESIYSMDGDIAPLEELVALKKEFGFKLYVDEAHAFGVRGNNGMGVAEELFLVDDIDYIIATLGKAAASSGAFIVCDTLSYELIVNRCRTLIFSTALPPISLMWSSFIIDKIIDMQQERDHLKNLSDMLREEIGCTISSSHIIPVVVKENSKALDLVKKLKEHGYWATAVRYPTVPKGGARVRISLNSAMNYHDIERLIQKIR